MPSSLLYLLALPTLAVLSLAQVPTIPQPGQPTFSGVPGQFSIVGNSLVSAQQASQSVI